MASAPAAPRIAARQSSFRRGDRNTRYPFNKRNWGTRSGGSVQRAGLPVAELLVELVLLLRRHRLAAGELAALVEELGEDLLHLLVVDGRRLGDDVALQPRIGGGKALPAWQLRREIDLRPFRVARRLLEMRELREERLDEIR